MWEVLLKKLFTIQVEEPHLLELSSETHIDIDTELNILLLLKDSIQANLFMLELKVTYNVP